MANSENGDKFGPPIIPNCQRTALQEEKLKSSPFARQSKPNIEALANDTGIEIIDLPDSSEEYHTPPDHHSSSQNSCNEAHIPPAFDRNTVGEEDPMPVDDDGETQRQKFVNLTKETGNVRFPESNHHNVVEENDTGTSARQVFVEMPEREQENIANINRGKRKLPFSMKAQKQQDGKREAFTSTLTRVLKMVGEVSGGEEGIIDVLETAKMRGLSLPRPRWWPADGFKDLTP